MNNALKTILGAVLVCTSAACVETQSPPDGLAQMRAGQDTRRQYEEQRAAERAKAQEQRQRTAEAQSTVYAASQQSLERDRQAQKEQERQQALNECEAHRESRESQLHKAEADMADYKHKIQIAEEWTETHCKQVLVTDYGRTVCDDGSSLAKVCSVPVGQHREFRCPAGAPEGVTRYGVSVSAPTTSFVPHGVREEQARCERLATQHP